MVDLNGTLLAQILNFLILTGILALLAYKPLLQCLENRQNLITEKLETSEHERMEAEQLKKEYEAQIAAAHKKAQDMVTDAIKFVEQTKEQLLSETRAANAQLLQSTLDDIANDRAVVMSQLKNEVINLSILTATKILNHKLDTKITTELVADLTNKFDELKSGKLPC